MLKLACHEATKLSNENLEVENSSLGQTIALKWI